MTVAPLVNAFPSAGELAAALTGLGIAFHRKGEDLALKDPARRLTPGIVEAVRQHKQRLLALADADAAPVIPKRGGVEAAILALVTEAAPVSHTQIRRNLTERGLSNSAVVAAIGELQTRQRLIEHDLKAGYILAGAAESGEECNS